MGAKERPDSKHMEITIPERIVEAIEQGDELCLYYWPKMNQCVAQLVDVNSNLSEFVADTLQDALKNLSDNLPLTMKETALHGASKGGAE